MANPVQYTPTQIVEQYSSKVFAVVVGVVRSKVDAEEITQDVFLKIFDALPKFQNKSNLSTWIYRVAYNSAIDFIRKRKLKMVELKEHVFNGVENGEGYDYNKEEQLTALEKALERTDPEDAFLIEMYYSEKMSIEQITEITAYSASNVKVRLYRARKKLAELMNN